MYIHAHIYTLTHTHPHGANKAAKKRRKLHLTAAFCLSHFLPFGGGGGEKLCTFHLHLLECSLARKLFLQSFRRHCERQSISLLLVMAPRCGHRSLTFSKRSINLSVHLATYPLMCSSSPCCFSLAGSRLAAKVALKSCAHQDPAAGCRVLGGQLYQRERMSRLQKMTAIWTGVGGENMHLRQRETHLPLNPASGQGQGEAK